MAKDVHSERIYVVVVDEFPHRNKDTKMKKRSLARIFLRGPTEGMHGVFDGEGENNGKEMI